MFGYVHTGKIYQTKIFLFPEKLHFAKFMYFFSYETGSVSLLTNYTPTDPA